MLELQEQIILSILSCLKYNLLCYQELRIYEISIVDDMGLSVIIVHDRYHITFKSFFADIRYPLFVYIRLIGLSLCGEYV